MLSENTNPSIAQLHDAVERGEEYVLATGVWARRMQADLEELRRLRLKRVGGSVFKRPRRATGKSNIKSKESGGTRPRALKSGATQKACSRARSMRRAPGFCPALRPSGRSSSISCATRNRAGSAVLRGWSEQPRTCLKKLDGYRAEQIDHAHWLKYLDERKQEAAAETGHIELSIARRTLRVAQAEDRCARYPTFRRSGTCTCAPVSLSRVIGRGCASTCIRTFATLAISLLPCAREMEVLALKWDHVDRDSGIVTSHSTKTDQPRKVSYASFPQLREVIERRLAARERLERAGVISPSVFA